MARWTYADWITQTDAAAKLTRLNLHLEEVIQALGAETTDGDVGRSSRELRAYLEKTLMPEQQRLENTTADSSDATTSGRSRFVFEPPY